MFDIWWGDIELTTLTLIVSVVLLLPFQILLCFKVKSRTVRLLPVIILTVLSAVFIVLALYAQDWDALAYIVFAIAAGFMTFMCGIGWGIWAIVNRVKKKQ